MLVALIPIKDFPKWLGDYRPISLIRNLYKIIVKVLLVRIWEVMHKVVENTQSAFVGRRQMLDSVIVANEVIHEAKSKRKPSQIFKVDFEKAYNAVNWKFSYYMMAKLGFCNRWVSWIKGYLESSSISVLVKGRATREFNVHRGIRQGNPIAPFLFLIVAKGLG